MKTLEIFLTEDHEFVVFDPKGREVRRIDPVRMFQELSRYWVVHNGTHEYRVYKRKGHTYQIRKRVDEQNMRLS